MKIVCNRGALLDALNVAGGVATGRTTKPVLLCVKLSALADKLTIAATDLEVAIRYSDAQVQVEEEGEILLPADKLRDIVRESVDDTLSIDTGDAEMAVIKGQDSIFRVPSQNAEEFPPIPDFEGEMDFELPGGPLKQLIGQTLFAAARESTRYAFNGVLVVAKGNRISLVSTDGRRLAKADGDLSKAAGEAEGVQAIVPAKTMQLIEKLIDDPEETVGFRVRENQVVFRTSSATLTSSLVEGQFPPYEDVIPKNADKHAQASTADLLSAVRRSSLLNTEETKGVRMQFSSQGLVLSGNSGEAGEATINFPCKFEGEDIEIGFNPTYLVDALRVVDTDEVTLELSAPNRPGLLRAGKNFLYVIMPVNLS